MKKYQWSLQQKDIHQSMSGKGNSLDIAVIENFWFTQDGNV